MFRSGYFNSRYLSASYFNSGPVTVAGEKKYFGQNYFRSRFFGIPYFSRLYEGVVVPPTAVVTSIAIEVMPSSVGANSPVVVIAYAYDQFNRPMPGVTVTFNSTVPSVISTPSSGITDGSGRVVKNVTVGSANGTSNLFATAGGRSAYTVVQVTVNLGPNPITLTHGATIQVGSAGGGVQGPIRVKLSRRVVRWPTR